MGFMKLFSREKNTQTSASIAKERLKITISHQRGEIDKVDKISKIAPQLLAELKDEVIQVVGKYIQLSEQNKKDIEFKLEDNQLQSAIEVNIPID